MISLTDTQRIGVGLMGFGVFFLLFGVLLYFDRVLLGFGNILFVSGLPFITGLQNTFRFFFQRQKLRGSSFFLGGILLVLLRWPVVGMLCEGYGSFLLFKSILPLVSEFISKIPVLGLIFTLPGLSTILCVCLILIFLMHFNEDSGRTSHNDVKVLKRISERGSLV